MDTILVIDFGSQYTQLIARRVRELQVYCEILPWNAGEQHFSALHPLGWILSGGPNSVLPIMPRRFLQPSWNPVCPFWAFVMVCRRLPTPWAGRWQKASNANTGRLKSRWIWKSAAANWFSGGMDVARRPH